VTNGVYSLVRNPMHTGYLLIFIFGNNTYTYDNLIFIAAFIIGIVIGVEKEE
jgi:protein-S-isoprenylcysteine O-methyltransferase Ste14